MTANSWLTYCLFLVLIQIVYTQDPVFTQLMEGFPDPVFTQLMEGFPINNED